MTADTQRCHRDAIKQPRHHGSRSGSRVPQQECHLVYNDRKSHRCDRHRSIAAQTTGTLLASQAVKRASGIGSQADKSDMLKMARCLFGTRVMSHHEADAGLTGLAGLLKHRTPQNERQQQ